MIFHPPRPLLRLALAVGASLFLQAARAQDPPPAPPAPTTYDASDPKVAKQLDNLVRQKFSRDTGEIFQSLEQTGAVDVSVLNLHNRFLQSFRLGDWTKIRTELAAMPPDIARKIYDKMLAD